MSDEETFLLIRERAGSLIVSYQTIWSMCGWANFPPYESATPSESPKLPWRPFLSISRQRAGKAGSHEWAG